MPEFAFIQALSAFLAGPAGLTPAPVQVGGALPSASDQAPAVVLALQSVRRLRGGLGEGAETVEGILAWTSRIDLASPFLPGEPGFSLISPDRRTLTLPHGGLIRADGLDGALGPADIAVTVAGRSAHARRGQPERRPVHRRCAHRSADLRRRAAGHRRSGGELSPRPVGTPGVSDRRRACGHGTGCQRRRRGGADRGHRPRARRAEPARRSEAARAQRGRRDRDRRRRRSATPADRPRATRSSTSTSSTRRPRPAVSSRRRPSPPICASCAATRQRVR